MRIAVYIGKEELRNDSRLESLILALQEGGSDIYFIEDGKRPDNDTDMMLCVGGDGTFLSASKLVADTGTALLGVNMGRLGFLSENRPEDVAQAVLSRDYKIEDRTLLKASLYDKEGNNILESCPYALNEVVVHRSGVAMLGVEVSVDGVMLPTYWADGLLVATPSGSTAYSLSAGGPIVLPESRVLIVSPVAPHNLNVRPLIVPDSTQIMLRLDSRDEKVVFTVDNYSTEIPAEASVVISVAQFSLRRVRLNRSNFIKALTEKLYWGEDVRNLK